MDEYGDKAIAPIEKMLAELNADAVFGQVRTEGDTTLIPVAAVRYGFGYGFGSGQDTESNNGGGAGGGAMGSASPRGYIRIRGESVSYDPMVNPTRISLAGIMMVAWVVFWIGVTIRSVAKTLALRPAKHR